MEDVLARMKIKLSLLLMKGIKMTETVYKCVRTQSGEVYYSAFEQDPDEIAFDYLNVTEVPISEVPPFGIVQLSEE